MNLSQAVQSFPESAGVMSKGFGPDSSWSESDSAFPRKSLNAKNQAGLSQKEKCAS